MNTNSFGDYLKDIYDDEFWDIKDGAMYSFDEWFNRMSSDDVFHYAEAFSSELNGKLEQALKLVDEAIAELKKIRDMADEK